MSHNPKVSAGVRVFDPKLIDPHGLSSVGVPGNMDGTEFSKFYLASGWVGDPEDLQFVDLDMVNSGLSRPGPPLARW